MKTAHKSIMLIVFVSLAVMLTIPAAVVLGSGNVILDDQFTEQTLSSDWAISPGRGNYSLTDNPGYLRYIIDAMHTNRDGNSGYAKSLWLVRPFSGDEWLLKTAITYNMRPGSPTNNRNMHFYIRTPGADWVQMAYMGRSAGACDNNPYSNSLFLYAGSNGMAAFLPGSSPGNCIYPLPSDRWYFEIERNKDYVTVKASNDTDDSTFEYERQYTFAPGVLGNDQVIEFNGDGWYGSNNPPGYADFDFIKVVPTKIPVTIDIKPGSDPSCFNNNSNGVIPVAILGSADFDVSTIDTGTVQLEGLAVAAKGKSNKLLAAYEDVNGDGYMDLVVKIQDVDGTFAKGSGFATLKGNLYAEYGGTYIEGTGDICVTQ